MKFIRDIISEKRAQAAMGEQTPRPRPTSTLVLSDDYVAPLPDVIANKDPVAVSPEETNREETNRTDADSFEFDGSRIGRMLAKEEPASKEEGLFDSLDDGEADAADDSDYDFDVFDELSDEDELDDEFELALTRATSESDDAALAIGADTEEAGPSFDSAQTEQADFIVVADVTADQDADDAILADAEMEEAEANDQIDEATAQAIESDVMAFLSAQADATSPAKDEMEPEVEDHIAGEDMAQPEVAMSPEPAPGVDRRRSDMLRRFAAQHGQTEPEAEEDSAPMETGWTGAIPRPTPALRDEDRPAMPKVERTRPIMAEPEAGDAAPVDVPAPAAGRASRRAGRVKTRLLGFSHNEPKAADPFSETATPRPVQADFPVGWLVVVNGPGRGASFTLQNGVAQIGRGEDQAIRLDFGDNSISRANHAAVAYDAESRKFYLGHGGKANLVRLNNRPVLSTEELESGNLIRIGETTLRFVSLCGKDFDWTATQEDNLKHVSFG